MHITLNEPSFNFSLSGLIQITLESTNREKCPTCISNQFMEIESLKYHPMHAINFLLIDTKTQRIGKLLLIVYITLYHSTVCMLF